MQHQSLGENIVTYTPFARQRIGKGVPAETIAQNNMISVASQKAVNTHP
jgi:hypothetical protein